MYIFRKKCTDSSEKAKKKGQKKVSACIVCSASKLNYCERGCGDEIFANKKIMIEWIHVNGCETKAKGIIG